MMVFEDPFKQIGLLIISFFANLISALAGGGAGLLQLPALILFGFPFPVALATHKFASVALGIGATFRYSRERSLNPWFTGFILISGLPGVWLGAQIALKLPAQFLNVLLGLLTLGVSIWSMKRSALGINKTQFNYRWPHVLIGGLVLFLFGFLNGALSSGTGLFVTIWLVQWFRLDYRLAVAYTLILVGLFWNGIGAFVLGLQGQIAFDWLPVLLLGSISGGYIGAHISISTSSAFIKKVFEIVAFLMGTSLIFRSILMAWEN